METDKTNETTVELLPAKEAQLSKGEKKKKVPKPFPNHSLEESLKIAKAIKEFNAGNPWSPADIAQGLDSSSTSSVFFYWTSSSRDYGFTIGTNKAKEIELTALGRKYVFASSPEEEYDCLLKAFYNIKIFKDVFEHYKGAELPEKKYLTNNLQNTFGLDPIYHDEFIDLYEKNLKFVNTNKPISTSAAFSTATVTPGNKSKAPVNISVSGVGNELFVIMPFTEKSDKYAKGFFEEVFSGLIVPAASHAGLVAKTANKNGSDVIHATIINDILAADLILADLTEHNPNVLFELGLAIAFEKKVAIIRASGTKPIFDVDNLLRVFDYDTNLWKSTIERDIPNLTKHIEATKDSDGKSYLEVLRKN